MTAAEQLRSTAELTAEIAALQAELDRRKAEPQEFRPGQLVEVRQSNVKQNWLVAYYDSKNDDGRHGVSFVRDAKLPSAYYDLCRPCTVVNIPWQDWDGGEKAPIDGPVIAISTKTNLLAASDARDFDWTKIARYASLKGSV